MQYLNLAIAVLLTAGAVATTLEGGLCWWSAMYLLGALLAASAMKTRLSRNMVVFLAVAATVTMFIYFAGFFIYSPYLDHAWYQSREARNAFGLLLAGFCMKPVIANFSCRMKANTNTDSLSEKYRARRRRAGSGRTGAYGTGHPGTGAA